MSIVRSLLVATCLLAAPALSNAQGELLPLPAPKPIVGINTPGISPDGSQIAFTYRGDIWTVPSSGGTATRLTVHPSVDLFPRWSPDGKWIAFSSNREGQFEIYTMPSTGGEPRRLTYHTANDYVMDWSPDGTKILFYGRRSTESWQQYALDIKSGHVSQLTDDRLQLRFSAWSPDGERIAYSRSVGGFTWYRPLYHGSGSSQIYVKNLASKAITRVSTHDGTDIFPLFSSDGKEIFYVTDQLSPGSPNIVRKSLPNGRLAQVTRHQRDAVRFPSIARNGSLIAYQVAGALWTVRPDGSRPTQLTVYAPTDTKQNLTLRQTLTGSATEVEISPDGRTLALVIRGDIWTIPADRGGEARRLVGGPSNDHDIFWSPDSSRLSFVSDRNGNWDIFLVDVKSGEVKPLTSDPNDERHPLWSPDGKHIGFLRSGSDGGLFVQSADGAAPARKIADSYGPNDLGIGIESFSWSPDSRWIAFSRSDTLNNNDIYIVPSNGGEVRNITYFPADDTSPAWTSDGKHLVFLSSRERGPLPDLFVLPLQKPAGEQAAGEQAAGGQEVKIDFDEIEDRARRLTTQGVGRFQPGPDGRSSVALASFGLTADGRTAIFVSGPGGGPPDYYAVPIGGGPAQRLTATGDASGPPRIGHEANRFYALGPGGTLRAISRMGPAWNSQNVSFSARMEIDLLAERRQVFAEFWRRINTGFYDPKMHGVNWKEVRDRYEPLLDGVDTQDEFATYLLAPMVGELNASHTEVSPPIPSGPQTAELGLTFDQQYSGPGIKVTGYLPRGPNDDNGPRIKPGEFIIAVDGQDVRLNEAFHELLLDKAGKSVELLVNGTAAREGARTVKLTPITYAQWTDLKYEDQVRKNRATVEKMGGSRLVYIHIKAMDQASLRRFERELWGRGKEREALVLDVRGNGGGNIHDSLLEQLSRPAYTYIQPRDAQRQTQPYRAWGKPIVLLIDENSLSDAEVFPAGFRTLKLGKIVGQKTPGYVIGTQSFTLQDGTNARLPFVGFYGLDGKTLENNGVAPDVVVENTPEDIEAGRDRQLEAAVEILLKALPKAGAQR